MRGRCTFPCAVILLVRLSEDVLFASELLIYLAAKPKL